MTNAVGQVPVNTTLQAKKNPNKNYDDTMFVAQSTLLNSVLGAGVGGAFAYMPSIDEDEFIKNGQKINGIKDKVVNKNTVEDLEKGLKELFKGEQKDELIKVMKKAKATSQAKLGAVIFAGFGLLSALYQVHNENKNPANKQA